MIKEKWCRSTMSYHIMAYFVGKDTDLGVRALGTLFGISRKTETFNKQHSRQYVAWWCHQLKLVAQDERINDQNHWQEKNVPVALN